MVQTLIPSSEDDASSSNQTPIPFANQDSLNVYKQRFSTSIQPDGLRLGYGGFQKLFLVVNRTFNRHGFGTPEYTITGFLNQFVMEVGEFFIVTHPKLIDYVAGVLGVTSVLCEITERRPDYANGRVQFKVIDTRFTRVANGAFQIAAVGTAVPVYGSASAPQRVQYSFIALNTGLYSTGAVANEID